MLPHPAPLCGKQFRMSIECDGSLQNHGGDVCSSPRRRERGGDRGKFQVSSTSFEVLYRETGGHIAR